MGPGPDDPPAVKKCSYCSAKVPFDDWPVNPATGKPATRCKSCAAKNAKIARRNREAKRQAKSQPAPAPQGDPAGAELPCDCAARQYPCARGQPAPDPIGKGTIGVPMSWNAFKLLLSMHGRDACDISALVELEDTMEDDERLADGILAGNVVRLIRDEVNYRFNLHTVERGQSSCRFKYFCAQREGEQTTSQKGKPRANSSKERGPGRLRSSMDRWHCEGWLSVSIVHGDADASFARVHLYHGLSHKAYVDVSIPDDVKELIQEMRHSTPSKIYREVLRRYESITLNQKQIYAYWSSITKQQWHLDVDQVVSARKLLEQWNGQQVQIIPVPDEDGVSTLAFAFTEMVERLNTGVIEIGLDSTFKTNSAGYELYGILTEVNGQLMPLITILITTTIDAEPNAKQRVLEAALRWLHLRCPNMRFSLSDKDPSEINACRIVLSDGKHQLCYWHGLRYLEERLAKSTPPAAYDGRAAHSQFSFIDPTWRPGITNGNAEEDFDGRVPSPADFELHVEDVSLDDLETCLPPLFTLTIGEDKIPVWPAPVARKKLPKLPEFCPAEFRPHIVAMFRKHFHLHPSIPMDVQGTRLTAGQLHKSAVHQMYTFCWQHDLSQAWAYLWNRWYAPSQWPLWARAACPAIPVLKTTMIVESYWRVIKHRDLADFNRPRLDLLVYTLVNSTLPPLLQRLNELLGTLRDGRLSSLASWQRDFKAEWLELSKPDELRNLQKELDVLKRKGRGLRYAQVRADRLAELEADRARPRGDYHADLDRWTCSCPAYLISRFLLCKHLVRKATPLLGNSLLKDNRFWFDLRRRRLPPYYVLPGIHQQPAPDPFYHPTVSVRTAMQGVPPETTAPLSTASGTAAQLDSLPTMTTSERDSLPTAIDEGNTDRIFYTSPQKRKLKDTFNTALSVLTQPQGVDPRLLERVQPAVQRLTDFAENYHTAKRARTSQRTFKDTNKDTLFLD